MKDHSSQLSYEVELQPGEKLTVPAALADRVGPGRWVISIRPANPSVPIRDHTAFLNGYGLEDEGLYDVHPAG